MAKLTIRPPSFSKALSPGNYKSPTVEWLTETWHVTHSTLPMWKSKRNVRIQYKPLDPSSRLIPREHTDILDDIVTYQSLNGEKLHKIQGIDRVSGQGDSRDEWDWRGKGLLKIASSHWEVLGWGDEEGPSPEERNKWVVTMFAKTLFTPAGLDVYSRDWAGVTIETLEAIKAALAAVDDDVVKELAGQLFEVKIDDARTD